MAIGNRESMFALNLKLVLFRPSLNTFEYILVMATGLSRPGKSREGPGTGRDRTGPRDLEGPVVPWSRD